eukprot:tig00020816_g14160.t1
MPAGNAVAPAPAPLPIYDEWEAPEPDLLAELLRPVDDTGYSTSYSVQLPRIPDVGGPGSGAGGSGPNMLAILPGQAATSSVKAARPAWNFELDSGTFIVYTADAEDVDAGADDAAPALEIHSTYTHPQLIMNSLLQGGTEDGALAEALGAGGDGADGYGLADEPALADRHAAPLL